MTTFKPATNRDISGTSLKGYISGVHYQDLVDVFGEPHRRDGDKTQVEWAFKIENDVIATLYDWKTFGTPLGAIRRWNVGGRSQLALELLTRILVENGKRAVSDAW